VLKLALIPDRTPVKLAVLVPPELHETLVAYAAAYEEAYGASISVPDLVPAMLASFLEGDREFSRSRQSPRKGRGQ
jgi:hypothetical protein